MPPGLIAGLSAQAGLAEAARAALVVRQADSREQGPRGFVPAREPTAP